MMDILHALLSVLVLRTVPKIIDDDDDDDDDVHACVWKFNSNLLLKRSLWVVLYAGRELVVLMFVC